MLTLSLRTDTHDERGYFVLLFEGRACIILLVATWHLHDRWVTLLFLSNEGR